MEVAKMKKLVIGSCCVLMVLGALAAQGAGGQPGGETPEGYEETLVSPQTLLLGRDQGGEVTVHVEIPFSLVDPDSLELNGVPASGAFADNCGDLVAKFSEDAVKAIVAAPSAVLTLDGCTLDGLGFTGVDVVTVKVK
jgi:hypothetical protein